MIKHRILAVSPFLQSMRGHVSPAQFALAEELERLGCVRYRQPDRGALQYECNKGAAFAKVMIWLAENMVPVRGHRGYWADPSGRFAVLKVLPEIVPDAVCFWVIHSDSTRKHYMS